MGVHVYPTNPEHKQFAEHLSTGITYSTWQATLNRMILPSLTSDGGNEDIDLMIDALAWVTARMMGREELSYEDEKVLRFGKQMTVQWVEARRQGATMVAWA